MAALLTIEKWNSFRNSNFNIPSAWILPGFIAVMAIISLEFLYRRYRNHTSADGDRIQENLKGTWIPLLPFEEYVTVRYTAPGLQSKFICDNVDETILFLRERAVEITKRNPWVLGRLKRQKNPSRRRNKICLWVPDHDDEQAKESTAILLQVLQIDGDFTTDLPSTCHVKKGTEALDLDEPLVKLTVMVSRSCRNQIVVVLSVCHAIGDAATCYQLWSMFGNKLEPYAMHVERILDYKGGSWSSLGKEARRKFWWWLFWCEWGLVQKLIGCGPKKIPMSLVQTCRYIRNEWIQEQKQRYLETSTVEYVSSCDLLSSWFLAETNPSAGALVINMRHRCPRLTERHVGNYLEVMFFFPEEYKSPECVRQSVLTLGAFGTTTSRAGPGGGTCGVVTAWHTFYREMDLPNCECLSHLPGNNDSTTPMLPMMRIFRASSDQLAVECTTLQPFKDTSPLGGEVLG